MNENTETKKSPVKTVAKIAGATVGGFVILLAGVGIGMADNSESAAQVAAQEPKTVTKTVEAEPKVVTKTKEVEVPVEKEVEVEKKVADPSCAKALDYSDELIEYFGEALDSAADSIGYAMELDVESLDAETAKLEELTPKVETARANYDAEAATCRASKEEK